MYSGGMAHPVRVESWEGSHSSHRRRAHLRDRCLVYSFVACVELCGTVGHSEAELCMAAAHDGHVGSGWDLLSARWHAYRIRSGLRSHNRVYRACAAGHVLEKQGNLWLGQHHSPHPE